MFINDQLNLLMHSLEKPPLVAGKVRGAVNREQEAAHKGK